MESVYSNRHEFDIDVDELTEDDRRAIQPNNINVTLKDHQLTILQKCIDFETHPIQLRNYKKFADNQKYANASCNTRIGVIGDRVGSGKSYVVLSLIMANDVTQRENTIIRSSAMNNVVFFLPDTKKIVKTNMLIIPHNLCSQWETYIKRFSTVMKYKIINRQKYMDDMWKEGFNIEDYDLIVVTGTFFNKVARYISEKDLKLQRIFIDEVDNLNIPGCYCIDACFIWFVTASYGNLLYPRGFSRYDETMRRYIWCANGLRNSGYIKNVFVDLVGSLNRDFAKVLVVKNSEGYVERSMNLPQINNYYIKSRTPTTIRILNGIVPRPIIDCLNANDINGALSYVKPNNKGTEENIVSLLVEKYKTQLANNELNVNMINQMFFENEADRAVELDKVIKKNEDLKRRIEVIKERIKTNEMCIICYNDAENRSITKCCQNSFCFKCINIWMTNKATCPLCKCALSPDELLVVDENYVAPIAMEEDEPSEDDVNEKFDKYKNMEILLKNRKPGAKFLIFSSSDSTFQDTVPILNKLKIKYDYVKGPGAVIANMVKKYKEGSLDVLLINVRYYGSGLNLENTTDIIMFHKFDTQMENQVIGRAQRYGRSIPLNIHYLLYENELAQH